MGAGQVDVAWLEEVVVDGLVDEPELGWVDVEVAQDLRAQALGVDDDRVREPDGAGVVHLPVQARPEPDAIRVW